MPDKSIKKNKTTINVLCMTVIEAVCYPLSSRFETNVASIWAATWQNQENECAPTVFTVRMKKPWILSYPLNGQQRLWSDWADAQADLSVCWEHTHFVGFVMLRLISALHLHCMSRSFIRDARFGFFEIITVTFQNSHVMRKPVFGVFDQVRLKPACAATEAS